ncbi:hypothetical protein [Zavarzinia sp. CC-PAN008]|uniref:hypothetical protein n=1 Tax=Zavarzinia sp. CC-PAN008 TaxID=3243332 RepID=UPI003F7469FB
MDSVINAAARALAAGDPLGGLNRVALRDDPPALALRGIALAQLGDLERARALVRRAAAAFGPREAVARARCVLAEAEIAFAARDLAFPAERLAAARDVLAARGDRPNAAHARLIEGRRLLLVGRLDQAAEAVSPLAGVDLPPVLRATHLLVLAGIALRRLDVARARTDLAAAANAAARIPALAAEVAAARRMLDQPAARLPDGSTLTLEQVAALRARDAVLVDACRHAVSGPAGAQRLDIPLARRPVLFALARALATAWPADVPRLHLLRQAFGARHDDESHRARLRVEVGRLRGLLAPLAAIRATPRGFALAPLGQRPVLVVERPIAEPHGPLLAVLADGEAWSSSGLALALGTSQRSVQRALDDLAAAGKVQAFGRGPARRWTTPPLPGIATTLLLQAPLPLG